MNKKLLVAAVVFIAAVSLWGWFGKNQPQQKEIIFGVSLPLSGDVAEVGKAAKLGLELMLEQLQAKGLKQNYRLVFEDNQMSPQQTALTIRKLLDIDKVAAVFTLWNMSGNVAAKMADQAKIFSFSCSYGEESAQGKYNFNFMPLFEGMTDVLAQELENRKVESVALFISNNAGHVEMRRALLENLQKRHIKVSFDELFQLGTRDYRTAIYKAAAQKPDMYLILSITPEPYIFMKQLKEITGRNDNVTTIDAFSEMTRQQRPIANGRWFVDSSLKIPSAFNDLMISHSGIESQACTVGLVSSLQIFVEAIEQTTQNFNGSVEEKEAVHNWIYQQVKDYPTAAGKTTVVKEGLFDTPSELRMIKNGAVVLPE